jgi:putative ABC transport system permease protein
MSTLFQDIRFGVRTLMGRPGFTLVTLMTLALGIGANTTIFGIVNTVLLRPLPFSEPDRVVMLWSHWINWKKTWVSESELADYRNQARSLEHVAAFSPTSFNLTGSGDPARVRAVQVQADIFPALGVQPIVGRAFTADEDQPGREHLAVIGEGLWRERFGSDRKIVGRDILLDGTPYTVLGVLPAAVRLPSDYATRAIPQVWVPLALGPPDPLERGNHGLNALARLKPGVPLAQAQAEMDSITRGFLQTFPNLYDAEFGLTLVSAPTEVFGEIRPALLVLLAAVGAVLLIACSNVANLLLARSESRQKEIAIRSALGADRSRLVRQLITEAMLLSLAGGMLGVGLAEALTRALIAADPLKIPRVETISIDGRVLIFAVVMAMATGIVFGLVPALHTAGRLQPILKEGGRDSRATTGWLRHALVIVEIATAVVLVSAAMLLARSFVRLMRVDPGFNPEHVLTFRTSLPDTRYPDAVSMVRAYRAIAGELRAISAVEAAGAVSGLPLATTRGDWSITIEGRPATQRLALAADWQVVTPGYFAAMGTPLKAGQTFTDTDQPGTLPVIVINEKMARTFWPGQSPIGRRLTMGRNDRWLTVIGIVADVRHRGLDREARTEMYRPHAQFRFGEGPAAGAVPTMTWVLKAIGDPLSLGGHARQAVQRVDPGLGISDVQTMEQVLADSTSDRRLNALLFALLGGLALVLATVGVYGVVAYSVTERTHEIGVRMAVGARPVDVLRMVIAQGSRLALVGVGLGLILTLACARAIRGLLFQISALDPTNCASVALVMTGVAILASYVPARRATRVDPMVVLRGE